MQIKRVNDGGIFPTYLIIHARLDFLTGEWHVTHVVTYRDPNYTEVCDVARWEKFPRSSQLGIIAALRAWSHERDQDTRNAVMAVQA